MIIFCWTSKCFVLFEVIRLLKLVILLSKSILLTKLVFFNLAAKLFAVILIIRIFNNRNHN